jgi:hypothetical protein
MPPERATGLESTIEVERAIMSRDPSFWPPPFPAKRRPPAKRRKIDCVDCGVDTSFATGNGHYYMARDDVWLAAVPEGKWVGRLCLDCLERRLGRELRRADFIRTPFEIFTAMSTPLGPGEWLDEMWRRRRPGLPEIPFEEWAHFELPEELPDEP